MTKKPLGGLIDTALLILLTLLFCVPAQAASPIPALTCSYSDVNAVINGPNHVAVDGDVINIPVGSCIWTSGITVPVGIGISIIGAGQGATTITHNSPGTSLIVMRPTFGNSVSRVSSMTLVPQAGATLRAPIMIIGICTSAGCPDIRVDHITLPSSWTNVGLSGASTVVLDGVFGVVDHNTVGDVAGAGNGIDFVNVNHSGWKGVGQYGDNSWEDVNTFGTDQAVYLEDNTFNYAFGTDADGSDAYNHIGGARLVCRFNSFTNLPTVSACGGHGTETTGRPRGIRQGEFYGNSVSSSGGGSVGLGMRSGVGITFGNTFAGTVSHAATVSDQRLYRPVVFGFCNGANPYDVNDNGAQVWSGTVSSFSGSVLTVSGSPWTAGTYNFSTSNPGNTYYTIFNTTHGEMAGINSNTSNQLTLSWSLTDAASAFYGATTFAPGDSIVILSSRLYAAGTHTGPSGTPILTDATKSWSANQWAGYNIIDLGSAYSYQIGSNTSNSLTPYVAPLAGVGTAWPGLDNGDPYVILRAARCLDQGSSYGGSLLSGEVPAPMPTAQTLSASYEFADHGNVTAGLFSSDSLNVLANRDYYFTNPSFDGSSGTGSGPLANRPGTCTPGVAYWATDQGNWNQSGNGFGQGELFVCTAGGTWGSSPYYTPYAYPHPLVSGTTPPSGQIYRAASCSQNDVQTAINNEMASAADGDVIVIPPGTCTWTGTTEVSGSFTTSVTLMGAGAISATTGGASTTGSDATVIFDDINHAGGPAEALNITTVAGKSFQLTGIAMLQNSGSDVANNAMVEIHGNSTSVRVDHCHFYMLLSAYQVRFDGPLGVIDHDFFDGVDGAGGLAFHYQGTSGAGDESWADTDHFGTSQFVYVEDSLFNRSSLGDSHDGGRYVIRHNTITSADSTAPQMYNHGLTDSRGRSMRAAEVYQNNLIETNPNGVGQPTFSNNGGTTLYWGNTISGYRYAVELGYTRQDNSTYSYAGTPNGWGHCGASGGDGWDGRTTPSGYPCLDQAARGGGDLLSGNFPTVCNQTQGCSTYAGQWPRQTLSPIYVWNNTFTPASGYSPVGLISSVSLYTDNVDYYQQFGTNAEVGNFDGTKGVGQGLLSARPPTCTAGPGGNTPGVGYWATDTNTLYVCNPTNIWELYYTPYTYPHPLVSGSSSSNPICGDGICGGDETCSSCPSDCGSCSGPPPPPPPTTLPVPDLSGLNGKSFSLTDMISFSYSISGVSFGWTFTPFAVTPAKAVPEQGTSRQILLEERDGAQAMDWVPTSVPEQGTYPSYVQEGKGYVGMTSKTSAATTSAPRFTPASAGLSPGTYQLTVTVTQGNQSQSATATITLVVADLSSVKVYPNPWRSDKHAGKSVTFANLPIGSAVKLFTTSGHKVRSLSESVGQVTWDLTNDSGDKVGSGIYVYLITDGQGNKVKGKVAVIK